MVDEDCRKMAKELVKEASKRGLIKNYSDWCNTEEAKEEALTREESEYYESKKGEN